jgi:hypothetical protein
MRWKDGAYFAVNIFGRGQWWTVGSWVNHVVGLRFVCASGLLERGRRQARPDTKQIVYGASQSSGFGESFLVKFDACLASYFKGIGF